MIEKRTICVATGSRAEYGLLRNVMQEIKDDDSLELQVLVTGMHLASQYGDTWKEIENDGFSISARVAMLENENSAVAVARSTGRGVAGSSIELSRLNPDLLVVLGDRFETFAATVAATFLKIPIAHFHGGETTEGAFDEALRHSITKMSHLHFTAAEEYRQRVIQLGEAPSRVFNVGAVGLDNMNDENQLSKEELETQLGFEFRSKNLLVTFHPVTLEEHTAGEQFSQLLEAIDAYSDVGVIFTHPNADPESQAICAQIDDFVSKNSPRAKSYTSLGFLRYLSTLRHVDAVVGNSSSGLIEAPHFRTPTINIGDRQKGRIAGSTVIHCEPDKDAIQQSIEQAISSDFLNSIHSAKNPYGIPGGSRQAVRIMRNAELTNILKKKFFDV